MNAFTEYNDALTLDTPPRPALRAALLGKRTHSTFWGRKTAAQRKRFNGSHRRRSHRYWMR